jgi:hypothetical protein
MNDASPHRDKAGLPAGGPCLPDEPAEEAIDLSWRGNKPAGGDVIGGWGWTP